MKLTSYSIYIISLWVLLSCFKCGDSKKYTDIFGEVFQDKFFEPYFDKGKINLSIYHYSNEDFCKKTPQKISCTEEKIDDTIAHIELLEFKEVANLIRLQFKCHLANDKIDKLYSCSYTKSSNGYKLKDKYIDEM